MEETNSSSVASPRRDLVLAITLSALGIAAIAVGRGGLGVMIAGSIGSVGAGVAAVGLAALDRRLSYSEKAQASVPIAVMLLVAGLIIGDNAWALAGYPFATIGLVGLVPALFRAARDNAPNAAPELREDAIRGPSEAPAMQG
jgi:hypothetical protein